LMIYKEAHAICEKGSYFYETFLSGKTSHEEETLLFQSAARRTFGGSPKDCITRNAVLGMCRGVGTGIGEQIAYAISLKYTTPKDLIHAYDACQDDEEREMLLAPIKLKNSKRTVAQVASTRIFEGVYGRREDSDNGKSTKTKSAKTKTVAKPRRGQANETSKTEKRTSKKTNMKLGKEKTHESAKDKSNKSSKSVQDKSAKDKTSKGKSIKTNKKRKPKRIVISDSDEEDDDKSSAKLIDSSSDSD